MSRHENTCNSLKVSIHSQSISGEICSILSEIVGFSPSIHRLREVIDEGWEEIEGEDIKLEVEMVLPEEISSMNFRYLGRRGPTDVLSFSLYPWRYSGGLLGVILLNSEEIIRGGRDNFIRKFVHGWAHILGYDHGLEMNTFIEMVLERLSLNK